MASYNNNNNDNNNPLCIAH